MTLTTAPETITTMTAHPTLSTTDVQRPIPAPFRAVAATIGRTVRDHVFNVWNLGFAVGLPVVMYLMFGTGQEYSSHDVGNGNVAATILVSMSLYGAIMTSSAAGTAISVERAEGWTRQLALTPMSPRWYVAAKVISSVIVAAIVVSLTFLVGFFTDAEMEPGIWFVAAAVIVVGSLATGAMGLAVGYWMRSDAAHGVMGGATALMAFFSGMFIPLDRMGEFFRTVAPWTPLYGINQLGQIPVLGEGFEWGYVLNVVCWLVIFSVLAVLGRNRDTERV